MQPHFRKFHGVLELQCLHVWKLSSNLSAKQVSVRRLQMSSQPVLGNPWYSLSGKLIKIPPLVLWNKMASCKASLQQIAHFFLYLRKELRLSILAIRVTGQPAIICLR